jgi:Uma2 family endonuclease
MSEPAYPLLIPEEHDGKTWPAQGDWTYEDYLRIPRRPDDGRRFEVIRGVLYVTATPTSDHQFAVVRLSSLMDRSIFEIGQGTVLVAPFDIRLPENIADPVQPDLIVFKTGNEPGSGVSAFEGVPDLVIEVLSPRTRRRDQTVQLEAYRDAGIPEYWIVDPAARTVTVYGLGEDRSSYVELGRYEAGEEARSAVFPDLRIQVEAIFWPR